ncbi:phosphatidyl synthase, partial [Ramicandelaber brevisporus]
QPSPSSQPNTNGNAVEVHENIYTVPNFLTLSRILASPYIGYLIVHQHYQSAMIGCLIFGATDVLDGYIARRFNSRSVLGSIMDPFADKVLVTTLVISMAWNTDNPLLPLPLAAIILGRDLGLIISAFYFRYISLPPPKTLVRFFDVTLPSAEVRPTTISKVNTVLQVGLLAASLAAPATGLWELDDTWMSAFRYLVGTTTVLSGLSYVFSKDAVRIVAQTKKPK